jgi:hypothetical protein
MTPATLLREVVEDQRAEPLTDGLAASRPLQYCAKCGRQPRRTTCWACGAPLAARRGRPRVVCSSRDCRNLRIRFVRQGAPAATETAVGRRRMSTPAPVTGDRYPPIAT